MYLGTGPAQIHERACLVLFPIDSCDSLTLTRPRTPAIRAATSRRSSPLAPIQSSEDSPTPRSRPRPGSVDPDQGSLDGRLSIARSRSRNGQTDRSQLMIGEFPRETTGKPRPSNVSSTVNDRTDRHRRHRRDCRSRRKSQGQENFEPVPRSSGIDCGITDSWAGIRRR